MYSALLVYQMIVRRKILLIIVIANIECNVNNFIIFNTFSDNVSRIKM